MLVELNQVMDYIDQHLTEELTLEAIADYAGVSDYHFRQVFFYLTGMSLSDYIKGRRLAEANQALAAGSKVTEVAFQCGYQSLDGFTRAFKQWSGCLPSEISQTGKLKSFPKLSFLIQVKGGISMDYRIEEKTAFNLVGVSKSVPMQFEGVNQAIVELANSITEEQRNLMHELQNIEPYEVVNASYAADYNFLKEEGALMHLIGVLTTEEEVDPLLDKLRVEAQTWAVFPNQGPFPATLQETMARSHTDWLPGSGYELVEAPTFSFTRMNSNQSQDAYSEIWLPVRKR